MFILFKFNDIFKVDFHIILITSHKHIQNNFRSRFFYLYEIPFIAYEINRISILI
jgi:hypothetical protein